MNMLSLHKMYLESISSQQASLSLSNLPRFYSNYIRSNARKVESELERVGYFTLKNKLSIGNSNTTTKDVFISIYFVNIDMENECNDMLHNKYHGNDDIRTTGRFFVPSTNELVVIIRVDLNESLIDSLNKSDIRSTIEHELTHAFDHTSKSAKLVKQNPIPGVGENFLSACAYLGCVNRSDMANLMASDMFSGFAISKCIYSISIILYKLFTITEFNAHQMSDLEKMHNVNIKRSDDVKKALKRDIIADTDLTERHLKIATSITPTKNPFLWEVVGKVLNYMGYKVNSDSPVSVYNFFRKTGKELFNKFIQRKTKNQIKAVISLKEKNEIKEKLVNCIKSNNFNVGVSFWFSPTGDTNSYICRIRNKNGDIVITVNHKPVKVYGNTGGILKRVIDSFNNEDNSRFEFAIDNLVDVIVQFIERNFNKVNYDPVYDITEPQDEEQINKSNKVSNRFADLDWD